MKKLLCLMLFTASIANADEIAWLPNNAGGQIVLTNETCIIKAKTYKNLFRSFMYTASGYTQNSCYFLDGSLIYMVYDDGREMRYPVVNFEIKEIKKNQSL